MAATDIGERGSKLKAHCHDEFVQYVLIVCILYVKVCTLKGQLQYILKGKQNKLAIQKASSTNAAKRPDEPLIISKSQL